MLCGGQDGKYSAIRLSGTASRSQGLDADARLPLDLDPAPRPRNRDYTANAPRTHPTVTTNSTVGSEIVNCITIWSPTDERSERAYAFPVSVVSNNDCTISFLDLRDSEIIETLTLPDCVNRSVMSPCGSMLASICDDPYLYIHERQLIATATRESVGLKTSQKYEWVMSGRFQLEGQKSRDKEDTRGSFAACFSKSGRYLAVATQYGIISVFETISLRGNFFSPHVFTTSQPGPGPGAVRAMEFSNGPYDLLAWTEAKGLFCVADVRNLFLSRQLIPLDNKAPDVERISVLDEEAGVVFDRGLRASGNDSGRSRMTSDLLAIEVERRQIRQLMLDRYDPPPFTAEETQVLHASQAARRQRDARNGNTEALSTSRSTWNEVPRSNITSTHQSDSTMNGRRISTTGLPPALRDFVTSDRTASFRSFINERNRESERRTLDQQEAGRRDADMLAAVESQLEQEVARIETETTANLERLNLEQSRLEEQQARLEQSRIVGSDSLNNPWAEIDALYRSRYSAQPPIDRTARLRVELEDSRRRDLVRTDYPWRTALGRFEGLTNIELGRRAPSVAHPGESMGCCWSPDGKVL